MRGQLGSIPDWFYYFSGLADKLEGSTVPVDKPNFLVYTRREPAGVVAAIVPWNSPLLLLCWKAVWVELTGGTRDPFTLG